jgi:serine/threonine-protein kinase
VSTSSVPSPRRARNLRPRAPTELDDLPIDRGPGTLVARRYRLQALVGEGASSEVWSARDERSGGVVAIKLVAFQSVALAESRARFQREVHVATRLSGPGFVPLLDHGYLGVHGFLVMPLLSGETLEDRLRRAGRLSPDATLDLVSDLCAVLQVAHSAGVVHRDLKPANVFLPAPYGHALLLDFGVASSDQAHRFTQPGTLLGSAATMSPEQIRDGSRADERSDLWSLAVVVYRCLSGERPFLGDSVEVMLSILNEPPRRLPGATPELARFFQQALDKEPRRRFPTAAAFIDAFRKAARPSCSEDAVATLVPPPRVGCSEAPLDAAEGGPPPESLPATVRDGSLWQRFARVFRARKHPS